MSWHGGAARAEPAKDQLVLANHPIAQKLGRRLGDVEPLHVFHFPAAVADKVGDAGIPFTSKRAERPSDGDLPHQPGFHQVAQVAVDGGPGRARVKPVHPVKDLRSRGWPGFSIRNAITQ